MSLFSDPYNFVSTRFTSLQAAVDAMASETRTIGAAQSAGLSGLVYIPPGFHKITNPIIIPRTDLNGSGTVTIQGAGPNRTVIDARISTAMAGRGVFETAPVTLIEAPNPISGNHTYRAWHLEFKDLTIWLPRTTASYGFYHKRFRPDLVNTQSHLEKISVRFENVVFQLHNDAAQVGIKIEGNCHDVTLNNITFDIGIFSSYGADGLGIEFDQGVDAGLDVDHCLSFRADGITTTPRRGGYMGVFKGRIMGGTIRNVNVGKGSLGKPQFHFINSVCFGVESVITEGQSENPGQIVMENCRGAAIKNFCLGTPNVPGSPPAGTSPVIGHGIVMEGCHKVQIDNWITWSDAPNWDDRSVKRVKMDADTKNCDVNVVLTDGVEGTEPITVVEDLGTNNRVVAVWPGDGARVEYFNKVLV